MAASSLPKPFGAPPTRPLGAWGRKPGTPQGESETPGRWPRPPDSGQPPTLSNPRPVLPKRDLVDTGPFYIRGMKASDLEWRTYRQLRRLGWRESQIQFQVDVLGGRLPGGQGLDFV